MPNRSASVLNRDDWLRTPVSDWKGRWIWYEGFPRTGTMKGHQQVLFRRSFQVPDAGSCNLVLHVTADSRYKLYLNGRQISLGPCKGDRSVHYYETVDVSEWLQPGSNLLTARVLHYDTSEPFTFGSGAFSIWRTDSGGLRLEGALITESGDVLEELHSDERWRCMKDNSLTFEVESWLSMFLGGVERVNGALAPFGWQASGYDDSGWSNAVAITGLWSHGGMPPWILEPRPIPALYERNRRFSRVMRSEGTTGKEKAVQSLCGERPNPVDLLHLEPDSVYSIELDAGELTTGYLQVMISGGAGSKVSLLCSESYEKYIGDKRYKGIRDDYSNGKALSGDSDIFIAAGVGTVGEPEIYEPFWFRTFRFVRLKVETASEPLVLHDFRYRETGYPLEVRSDFESSDPSLKELWEVSLRTLQRCMHETYEDCPYYEQLQYIMDTRLQILFTYQVSGDDRLARRSIHDFHCSLQPSGMLRACYPSMNPQYIPGFSLYWVMMLHDHYLHFADKALLKRYRSTMDSVLQWFEDRMTPEGLFGVNEMPYWYFHDWVEEWQEGVPPASKEGPNGLYSLLYAYTLPLAADIADWSGRPGLGMEYRKRAERIRSAVRDLCWSRKRGLFRDGPDVERYSQHMQMWGLLVGAVQGEEATALADRMINDESLPKVSYAMAFFLFRALEKAGCYERTYPLWETWRAMLRLNLTTWAEAPNVDRSDCHGWGSVPLYEFPAKILGVEPAEPGYARIRVQPKPGPLEWARGSVVTPKGMVEVDWSFVNGSFRITVRGPSGIPIEILAPGSEEPVIITGGSYSI